MQWFAEFLAELQAAEARKTQEDPSYKPLIDIRVFLTAVRHGQDDLSSVLFHIGVQSAHSQDEEVRSERMFLNIFFSSDGHCWTWTVLSQIVLLPWLIVLPQDVITHLRSVTTFGRPDFDALFTELKSKHPSEKIGVFFCGPAQLGASLSESRVCMCFASQCTFDDFALAFGTRATALVPPLASTESIVSFKLRIVVRGTHRPYPHPLCLQAGNFLTAALWQSCTVAWRAVYGPFSLRGDMQSSSKLSCANVAL